MRKCIRSGRIARTLLGVPGTLLVIAVIGAAQNVGTFAAGNLALPQGYSVTVGSLVLIMQGDGNLVLYGSSGFLWASNTSGQNCNGQCGAYFQTDGNFVVYNGSTPLWASNTSGNPSAQLVISEGFPHMEIVLGGASIWQDLNFPPGIAMNYDGRLEIFTEASVWSAGNQPFHSWQQSAAQESGWAYNAGLGGAVFGSPTAATNSDGRMETFMEGTDRNVWHNWQVSPGGGWSGWVNLGGAAVAGPPSVRRGAGGPQ